MSHNDKPKIAVIGFLVISITANEVGLPFLAILALILMPIVAMLMSKTKSTKEKD